VENLTYTGTTAFTGTGNTLANLITGGVGNDTLNGGTGSDTMAGGLGNDVYTVDVATDVVIENVNEGTDEVRTALASYTLGTNVENLTYTGTVAFTGTGNTLDNVILGAAGKDTLSGGVGNDTLQGGAGADSLDGGLGVDTVTYASATAAIVVDCVTVANSTGDAAGDIFVAIEAFKLSPFNDRFVGTGGNEIIDGGAGNDTILGNAGDDFLIGGAGSDSLDGGTGIDTASYSSATAAVTIDRVTAANSTGDASGDIFTAIEKFQLTGFADRFVGASADETIYAGAGNDTLLGNAGNDFLDGEAGADSLTGGAGIDTFAFDQTTFGKDIVTDFTASAGDLLQFSSSTFAGFAAVQSHMSQVGTSTVITFDANDTVTLQNVTASSLTAANFHFV
jgi:Ca2+-binding RTX toxin-like protein